MSGIPTFFFGERMVVGAQPYPTLAKFAELAGAQRREGSSGEG